MKSGHRTVEPLPGDVKAHSLLPGVEIKAGDTPAVVVSAIFELVTVKVHEELLMAVAVRRGGLLR